MDASPPAFRDDDLVYVDPDTRTVVGVVEWTKSGEPKPRLRPTDEIESDEEPAHDPASKKGSKPTFKRRKKREKYYPWGTYRAMKRIYKIEGKEKWNPPDHTLDDVIEKALKEPFWD